MEEWIRTIIGGLIGGGIAATVSWLKYRDERRDQLRVAYVDLFLKVQGLWMTTSYVAVQLEKFDTSPTGHAAQVKKVIGEILAALVRVEFLETSESCIAKINTLREAVAAFHLAHIPTKGPGVTEEQVQQFRKQADSGVIKAREALMREAKASIDRRWSLDAPA